MIYANLRKIHITHKKDVVSKSMIIVRYGEIGLKGKLRRSFENLLIGNIRNVLRNYGFTPEISSDWGRIYIHSSDEKIARLVSGVFGVTSTSIAYETGSELDEITEKALELSEELIEPDSSFAVRARRTGKHDYSSMDVQRVVGGKIKSRMPAKVDLRNPDAIIYIEVRDERAFIFSSIIEGFGGLPVGSQERVLSLVSDRKSLLSTWYALRRGCDVDLLCTHPAEYDILKFWASYREIKIIEVNASLGEAIRKAFRMNYRGIFYPATYPELERLIGEGVLRERKMPVFFPLISLTNNEIEDRINMIKNYFKKLN